MPFIPSDYQQSIPKMLPKKGGNIIKIPTPYHKDHPKNSKIMKT